MLARTIHVFRRNLPHWQTEEGTYFITFRLIDSLPSFFDRRQGQRQVEEILDRGFGPAYLAQPEIADVVFHALRFFDGRRYTLHSGCVMPNHVHAVLRTAPRVRLSDVTHSWKGFTANRANALLGRRGAFWEYEYYDRLIRDANEFARANEYVLRNPEKAGLRNWRWVGAFDSQLVVRYGERQA